MIVASTINIIQYQQIFQLNRYNPLNIPLNIHDNMPNPRVPNASL